MKVTNDDLKVLHFTSFAHDIQKAYMDYEAEREAEELLAEQMRVERNLEDNAYAQNSRQRSHKKSRPRETYGFIGRTSRGPIDLLPAPLVWAIELAVVLSMLPS